MASPDSGAGTLPAMEPAAVDLRQVAPASDRYPVPFAVVALIASAGGLDALFRVLSPLPQNLPAAVLVALHQEPTRVSQLVPLLARHTSLPVQLAGDETRMQPGRVMVAPPAHHLLVTSDARIGLSDTGALPPPRPSADLLLATLAVTCGARALAVI